MLSAPVVMGGLHYTKPAGGVSDPRVVQFPPIGGVASVVCGGVAPKSQTISVKDAEDGLVVVKWSAFWAQRYLAWCIDRT